MNIFITIKNMMSNYEILLNCTKFCMVLASAIIRYSAKNSTQVELSLKSNSEMIYNVINRNCCHKKSWIQIFMVKLISISKD